MVHVCAQRPLVKTALYQLCVFQLAQYLDITQKFRTIAMVVTVNREKWFMLYLKLHL